MTTRITSTVLIDVRGFVFALPLFTAEQMRKGNIKSSTRKAPSKSNIEFTPFRIKMQALLLIAVRIMTKSKMILPLMILGFCACILGAVAYIGDGTSPAFSQDNSGNADTPADNSEINQRDRSSQAITADQAGQHLSDRDIMQSIRKSVVEDKSLSTYAHNIKIISMQGTVTLKGPVRSQDEKQSIIAKATAVDGVNKVVDRISVKPASP